MAEGTIEVVGGVEGLRPEHGPVFAVIGVFDGIHVGHQYLLANLVAEAHARSARPSVITFDSHPDEILVGAAPPLLLDPVERMSLLAQAAVEVVVVEHFDEALRATEYDEFIHRISERTELAGLLMTPDAAFGRERRGTPDSVRELADRDGFDLVVLPPFELNGRSVRSADIRAAIAAGDLAAAAELLGRQLTLRGDVRDGTLRFRAPVALPPDGSYRATVMGRRTSVTVRDGVVVLEDGQVADGPVTMTLDD